MTYSLLSDTYRCVLAKHCRFLLLQLDLLREFPGAGADVSKFEKR
jgi:hypothetical protein